MKALPLWMQTLALLGLTACSVDLGHVGLSSDRKALTDAEEVRDIVLALPPWLLTGVGYTTSAAAFDGEDFDAYTLTAIKLQGYSTTDVRSGIGLALANSDGVIREASRADVFVLLRVLFDVPATVSMTAVENRSPYAVYAFSTASSTYPLRWPVTVDSNNVITGIAGFMAARGGEYNALDEYDHLESEYGLRDLPSCVDRCGSYNSSKPCQCDTWCETYEDCCVDYDYTCGTSFVEDPERPE